MGGTNVRTRRITATIIAIAAVTVLAAGNQTASAALPSPNPPASGTYIVRYAPGTDIAPVAAAATASGVQVERTFTHAFPGLVVTLTPAQAAAWAARPGVLAVEANAPVTAVTQTNPPWGLDRIDQRTLPLSGTYTATSDGAGVTAYIIDTGIRGDHADLIGRVGAGYSAIADSNGTTDCNGHGTHVAATVAGTTYGVAKAATVVPVRVLDCAGSGTTVGVVAGIEWAITAHLSGALAVANMSLGGGASSSLDTAVANLVADGVSVAVAAGNRSADACTTSPARAATAITVGASDSADWQASFSNFGTCLDLYAPGVSVLSAWYTSTTATATLSGTSMAAPHVAGAAALLLARTPTLTPAALTDQMLTMATTGALTGLGTGSPNRLLFVGDTVAPPPTTVPAAPTGVTATAGKRSATVAWTQGSNGGSVLTGQTVTVYSGATKIKSVAVVGTATQVKVTGLLARTSYSFTVSATNAAGTSVESARSNAVTVL